MLTAAPHACRRHGAGACRVAAMLLVLAVGPIHVQRAAASPSATRHAAPTESPPGFELSAVAPALRIDTRSIEVVEVTSTLPLDLAIDAWARWWRAAALPLREARVGDWRVLSRISGDAVVTVQLRAAPGGGSAGYLAIGRALPGGSSTGAGTPLRLPAGARLLRTVDSQDAGGRSTQSVVAMHGTARSALAGLAHAARAAGWSPMPVIPDVPIGSRDAARALWFQRGTEELGVLVTGAATEAVAVLHHVRAPRAYPRGR